MGHFWPEVRTADLEDDPSHLGSERDEIMCKSVAMNGNSELWSTHRQAQYSKVPLPLPIRVSLPCDGRSSVSAGLVPKLHQTE